MIVKRTYSFSERVRVMTLTTPEPGTEYALDQLCSATRIQQMEFEVTGEELHLSAQTYLLEIELPDGVDPGAELAVSVGSPLRAEIQRPDTAEPEARHALTGVLAAERLLMVVLPPDTAQPAAEKTTPLGFRAR